jgi:hypothetical protein
MTFMKAERSDSREKLGQILIWRDRKDGEMDHMKGLPKELHDECRFHPYR